MRPGRPKSCSQGQVAPEIHHQQAVVALYAKKAQHEGFRTQDRAIQAATALGPEHRILTPQPQQVMVQRIHPGVALPFGKIEL